MCFVNSILHHWACILISEGHFIEYFCWWELVFEFFETLSFLYSFCHIFLEWEMNDLLLGTLGHCPFHHYIHCWCDFHFVFWFELIIIPLYVFVVSPLSLLLLLIHPFRFTPCSFPTMTYSKFDTFFTSSLNISLSIQFASLSHYWYYIHIRHPQVYGSRDFLYMLHFIHEGMSFDHRIFEPSFFSYLHPITLTYVSSSVLRPPWGHEIRCHIRQPLLGQVFEIWSIFRCHHASSSRKHLFDVWIRFSYGYGWLGLHIWWCLIQCCLIFRSTIHLMLY